MDQQEPVYVLFLPLRQPGWTGGALMVIAYAAWHRVAKLRQSSRCRQVQYHLTAIVSWVKPASTTTAPCLIQSFLMSQPANSAHHNVGLLDDISQILGAEWQIVTVQLAFIPLPWVYSKLHYVPPRPYVCREINAIFFVTNTWYLEGYKTRGAVALSIAIWPNPDKLPHLHLWQGLLHQNKHARQFGQEQGVVRYHER